MADSDDTKRAHDGYAHRLVTDPLGEKRCSCGYAGLDVLDHIQAANRESPE